LFIRGLVWLAIPGLMVKWVGSLIDYSKPLYIATTVNFILGIILCYYGFN
jgi:hypothetical protein